MIHPGSFLKRHTLLAGFAAFLLPLLILLVLQYLWLARLERVSAIAHEAALENYLEAISSEVQYFYRSTAERSLNLPASLFALGQLHKAAAYWERKPVEGARLLFLVDFTRERYGNFRVYNPELHTLEVLPASDEALAIIIASTPWHIQGLVASGQKAPFRSGLAEAGLTVDERDPETRIILNPITDDSSRVVGIAGMIVDQEYFLQKLLPELVKNALPGYFPSTARHDLTVTIEDAKKAVVFTTGARKRSGATVTRGLSFLFSDWTLILHSGSSTPQQWARANFALNMTLSALLTVALAGGVLLALRAADRAMKLSQMKSDFVSNVSHELRTPLASIRAFGELLRLGRLTSTDKVQEYGEHIEIESRRLSRLIDNILDFSRIESGHKTYSFAPAELSDVVESTLESFRVRLKDSGFQLLYERGEGSSIPVNVDPDAVSQALGNLLDNAVKYSGDSRKIIVRLSQNGSHAVVSVQDFGIGIPEDERAKIFERFHRVGGSLIHDVKGSGLGLSIVHHIVEAHRGRVTVESEPGRGSLFSIYLPVSMVGPADSGSKGPQ